ncbi:MAG: ROK family protein [Cyclobacteriaceae bacterium]|nr:ROK family protein [Cyclobacteriaceae bacterium]
MTSSSHIWGIDLGGTKVEGAVLKSALQPDVLFRDRLPAESDKGYQRILEQICKVVRMMEEKMGYLPDKIGIATPGTLDPFSKTMKNCNSTELNGKPLKADLERMMGLEFRLANDANCFALAETRLGIVKEKYPNAEVVFGVIMGTGVGGGVVVNGKAINGLHGIGGEWGHNYLDDSAGMCYCGKTGCVENVMSGPATEKYYASLTGQKLKLKEIYQRHLAGTDPQATQTIHRLTHFFGKALSVIINILDPDVIVVGGGVGNIDALYTEGIDSLRKYIFNNRLDTPVLKPRLGDSAGVFGAAYLVAE